MVVHAHIEGGVAQRDASQVLHFACLRGREQDGLSLLWKGGIFTQNTSIADLHRRSMQQVNNRDLPGTDTEVWQVF